MRTMVFASRNTKEMMRDKTNVFFGIGFPLILLLLLTAIQANVPVPIFEIENITPGIAAFGLSFIALFSGMLIAKDRTGSFLMRLFSSPLTAKDFIFGYTLPLIPMAIVQSAVCYIAAIFLGLPVNFNMVLAILTLVPTAILFIGIGLITGSLFTDKQVGGLCGALLTNICAWLSGTWFDLKLVGGTFEKIANMLPFVHAVDAGRAALSGNYSEILPHLAWVIGYAVVIFALAIVVFRRAMKKEEK